MIDLPHVLQFCLFVKFHLLYSGLKVVGHATPAVFNTWPVVVAEAAGGGMLVRPGGGVMHIVNNNESCLKSSFVGGCEFCHSCG